ncbi:MAG: hypothetical protein IPN19_06955 [Elusimicrobia bacterium]|nr:hypothetical protein [Elusimicrobiota bacterium]
MKKRSLLIMSTKEIDTLKIIQDVIEKRMKQHRAGSLLKLSTRQVRRLCGRVRREGAKGLRHGLRGQPSNHQLPSGRLDKALGIVRTTYLDFGPTLANEKLESINKIFLSTSILRRGMIENGLWHPHTQGAVHRAWRNAAPPLANWFSSTEAITIGLKVAGRGAPLLIFIDDATSRILWGAFIPVEDTLNLLASAKAICSRMAGPSLYMSTETPSTRSIGRRLSTKVSGRATPHPIHSCHGRVGH